MDAPPPHPTSAHDVREGIRNCFQELSIQNIRIALQQRDATLYHRLETIWIAIAREIQERQQSKEGHQQGPLHCGMVEDNLGKLIPDDHKSNFFTPLELFLFSMAACYMILGNP
jgi:hypothetical protein